jgi:TcpE family
VELPTYTNIWKIEKRLYKLYDFRLPMPVPVGQVAAFLAIAIPYMVILTMAGMPFSHTWVWLYVLPPGALAWLVTRPVLEGKRLPELVVSQLRYLSEPRTWCRMAALAESDQIFVTATVWRRSVVAAPAAPATRFALEPSADAGLASPASQLDVVDEHAGYPAAEPADAIRPVWPTRPAIGSRQTVAPSRPMADTSAGPAQVEAPATPARATRVRAASAPAVPDPRTQQRERDTSAPAAAATVALAAHTPAAQAPPAQTPAAQAPAALTPPAPAPPAHAPPAQAPPAPVRPRPLGRPVVTVRSDGDPSRPLPVVERALRNSPGDRAGWHERVVMVPGGHRPGKPDQLQRDQARARFPLPGPVRIVVLGCTAGAGQTTTTLMAGQLLATLRGEAVAVLDIGSGPGSLTELARQVPRLLPSHRDVGAAGSGADRGLQVVTADAPADQPADAGRLIDAVVARYRITIADPAAAHVPRAAHVADQLVLVAPASADAAGSLAMTMEWLEAHGHAQLARDSVTVLNGVSAATAAYVSKAASVAAGRCRAVVQVPWDDRLTEGGALGSATVHAYTALAGVLIAGLADPASALGAPTPSGRR